MKAIISRTAAVAAMLVCLGNVQAEELNFSELESRLAKIESQLAGQNGMQQASYCCDSGGGGCCDSSCCCEASCGCDNGCCDSGCCGSGCGDCCGSCGGGNSYYASVDIVWARAHVREGTGNLGKLSEEYEIAPRFVAGYENCNGRGARIRYWTYGQQTNSLVPANGVRFDLDVVDLEVTNRFQFCRTDVTLAGGFRYAGFDVTNSGSSIDTDLIGLTMAADVEYLVCCRCNSYWSGIYGGRLSILGGDWEGTTNTVAAVSRDDNVVVTELYGGVEYGCCHCGYDIYTQLKFEMQNWASDNIDNRTGGSTIGFVGPSWTIGVGF